MGADQILLLGIFSYLRLKGFYKKMARKEKSDSPEQE